VTGRFETEQTVHSLASTLDFRSAFSEVTTMAPQHHPTSTRPLVLIVDGQQDRLALNALVLSTMGFDVLAADDMATAFGRAAAMSPDIIVTELVLRQTSGWDLLTRLKGEPSTRHIPVVMVAGNLQSTTRARALREGCASLLVQPCLPDRLALELRSLLVRHRTAVTEAGESVGRTAAS
jgi:CheY-like chemotaxis protein